MRRGLTLALTLFGIVLFNVPMLAIQAAIYITHLPNSEASGRWLLLLLLIPTFVTSIMAGLCAALGAIIGARASRNPSTDTQGNTWRAPSIGAGLAGAIASAPFLLFLSWFYQSGLGALIGVLGICIAFTGFAGFTALWWARGARTQHADESLQAENLV